MAQLESFLLKDRPFPEYNPINQVAFLTELKTRMLTGTHDADKIEGALVLFEAAEEISFVGMGGRDKHSYKGDLTGRDDGGVILTMISGPDEKTCLTEETRHPVYKMCIRDRSMALSSPCSVSFNSSYFSSKRKEREESSASFPSK